MIEPQHWLGLTQQHLLVYQEKHLLQEEVCNAFLRMQQSAAADKVDIQIVSSYRNFERQQHIWDAKWLGQRPILSLTGQLLDIETLTETEKLHAILTWSALPGASRHHWGTDLDVYDKACVVSRQHDFQLVSQEYEQNGPCYRLNSWLAEHAEEFGFYRPYSVYNNGVAPEAWHISYKPIADTIIRQLNIRDLADTLSTTTIQGKKIIMANLEEIFSRYTLNGAER